MYCFKRSVATAILPHGGVASASKRSESMQVNLAEQTSLQADRLHGEVGSTLVHPAQIALPCNSQVRHRTPRSFRPK
jgi:citrate lyase beta subunit